MSAFFLLCQFLVQAHVLTCTDCVVTFTLPPLTKALWSRYWGSAIYYQLLPRKGKKSWHKRHNNSCSMTRWSNPHRAWREKHRWQRKGMQEAARMQLEGKSRWSISVNNLLNKKIKKKTNTHTTKQFSYRILEIFSCYYPEHRTQKLGEITAVSRRLRINRI